MIFDRWGEVKGVSAALIIILSKQFRPATRDELAPEHYPFIKTPKLMRQTNCDSDEALRRRVSRCRNGIIKLAMKVGGSPPSIDAVIENSQWHGYRLNLDRVRLVAMEELSKPD